MHTTESVEEQRTCLLGQLTTCSLRYIQALWRPSPQPVSGPAARPQPSRGSPAPILPRRGSEETDKRTNVQATGPGSAPRATRHEQNLRSAPRATRHKQSVRSAPRATRHEQSVRSAPRATRHEQSLRSDVPAPRELQEGELKGFTPRLTVRDLDVLQEIVLAFSAAMKESALTFFLYSGSLLGSWRHLGLVPWDDDVDVAVPSRQALAVYRALVRLRPRCLLDVRQKKRWKLYSIRSHPIHLATWGWPFVDVSFYEENSTHLWDRDPSYPAFTFPLHDVFPLRERPFMGMMLPAPRDAQAVLGRTYNLTVCKAGRYDHRTESIRDVDSGQMSVPCDQLHHAFPFVWRQPAGEGHVGCNESLVSNGSVVKWILLDAPLC